ncbi:hypothetical protein D9M68_855300 [compost metagenome]
MGCVVAPEDQRHQQADADAEHEAQHQAGHRELRPEDAARVGQRHDVSRRREEQEGHGRANAGTLAVNAGEQRNDGAGAHRQQRPGRRRCRVGNKGGHVAPQPPRDAGLGNQGGHGPGDEKRRQQAQQDVRRQVSRQTAGPTVDHLQEQFHTKHALSLVSLSKTSERCEGVRHSNVRSS